MTDGTLQIKAGRLHTREGKIARCGIDCFCGASTGCAEGGSTPCFPGTGVMWWRGEVPGASPVAGEYDLACQVFPCQPAVKACWGYWSDDSTDLGIELNIYNMLDDDMNPLGTVAKVSLKFVCGEAIEQCIGWYLTDPPVLPFNLDCLQFVDEGTGKMRIPWDVSEPYPLPGTAACCLPLPLYIDFWPIPNP